MTNADMPAPVAQPEDVDTLAEELARAYHQMASFYHHKMELSLPEANRRARGQDDTAEEAAADTARIMERPPTEVSWFDMNRLLERDPDALAVLWRTIRAQASTELASGQRTAKALEWQGRPWARAQFLAIREGFRASTPPQTAIESALLDAAAEAFGDYLAWQEHLHMQVSTEVASERNSLERHGEWTPARLSYAEAIEQSAKMAERAHKRFLQTVKLLHDLQRTSATVYVGSAGQINVGQQQVNVASAPRTRTRRTDLPKSSGGSRRRRTVAPARQAGEEG
jgi:hypothetical protein